MVSRHFSLDDLSFEHEEQVKSYLKFFRSKREVQLKEIEACFEDQREMMFDEMYSKEDVEKMLGSLCSSVRSSAQTDLKETVNMSMLVLRQLLEEAESEEIEMNLDMTVVEDQSLLSEVNMLTSSDHFCGIRCGLCSQIDVTPTFVHARCRSYLATI